MAGARRVGGWLWPRGWRGWRRMLLRWGAALLVLLLGGAWMFHMPGRSFSGSLPPLRAEEEDLAARLEAHVRRLAGEIGERNLPHYAGLREAEAYLLACWREMGAEPERQTYLCEGREVANLQVEITGGARADEILVVGAHYDSVFGSPGANDNASGVAALLELSRRLLPTTPRQTLRLVAFVNEEPPYFMGPEMGSRVYAERCRRRGDRIVGMISLETLGCYRDQPGSQAYPPPFSLFYPSTGNFVAFVGNLSSRSWVRESIASFRRHAEFPSEGTAAPGFLTGVGWSDHWSFWKAGYPALMLTDTALFRYPHYHDAEDTPEKLDYARLARVVVGVEKMLCELAGA